MTETAYDTSKPNVFRKASARLQTYSPFKRTFIEGMMAGTAVLLLLFLWMAMRADRTAEKLQPLIPVEAVEITKAQTKEEVAKAEAEALPKSADALPVAPIDGLFEKKDDLVLPISRIEDDMTPFQAYKRPFKAVAGRPMISVVVVDFGLSATLSQDALKTFPSNVSLALTPYAKNASGWGSKARADGHEIWLSLPMQAASTSDDAGPNAIILNAAMQENQSRLYTTLGAAVGYTGLVAQRNHAFTGDDIDIAPVLKQIYGRGLGFADSNPSGAGFGQKMAAEMGVPYVHGNLWVGDDLRSETIDRILHEAELLAMKQGRTVVFAQPYPVVLKKLSLWIEEAGQRGLQFAPLSALAQ